MKKDPYRRVSNIYDRYIEPTNRGVRQIGLKLFPPQAGMRVLDVGCGTGTNLELYHQMGCDVYGIDTSSSMLTLAKRKLGERAHIRHGDASDMPYPSAFFDLVTAMLTLHEMPGHIRPQVVSEMRRVLRPAGRILMIDFHPGPLKFPKGWVYRGMTLFFEVLAGREHFRNYRNFLAQGGLPGLLSGHGDVRVKEKIISGGNLALFLLS